MERRDLLRQRPKGFLTKQELVYEGLRQAITTSQLQPHQRLVLDEIATEYGVSRVPVREALLQLHVEGFVDMDPHSGARVVSVSADSLEDYFDFTEVLALLGIRAVCTRHQPEELRVLRHMVHEMETTIARDDLTTYAQLNNSFHTELAYISRVPLLSQVTQLLLGHWQRVRLYCGLHASTERIAQAMAEHHAILEAVAARDADLAQQVVQEHCRAARYHYLGQSRPMANDHEMTGHS